MFPKQIGAIVIFWPFEIKMFTTQSLTHKLILVTSPCREVLLFPTPLYLWEHEFTKTLMNKRKAHGFVRGLERYVFLLMV